MSGSGKAVRIGLAALLIVVIGVATWFYAQQGGAGKDSGADLSGFATGAMQKLTIAEKLEPATDHVFQTRDGSPTRFSDFKGRVVVVNLWATWCAPCLTEMPTLAALARRYTKDDDVLVLPINVDVADQRGKAEAFIAGHPPLPFYSDPSFQLPFEFEGRGGMPQTILLDRQGRVRAMLTGGADWASPETIALIETLKAEPG